MSSKHHSGKRSGKNRKMTSVVSGKRHAGEMSAEEYIRAEVEHYFKTAPPPEPIVIIGWGFMQPDMSYRPSRKPSFMDKIVHIICLWVHKIKN